MGISQAALSELEQDKYKPSVEIITSIVSEFHTDVTWLPLGTVNADDKVIRDTNEKEANLLLVFEKLTSIDQDEIIDFMKTKLGRD